MAAPVPCIYKSINLSAGETFVLPPGAEIISVSDTGAVTSSCGALPQEDVKCYQISWVVNKDPEGDRTIRVYSGFPPIPRNAFITIPNINNAWEDDDDDSTPILVSNIGVAGSVITGGMSCRDFTSIEGAVFSSPTGGILSQRKYLHQYIKGSLTTTENGEWNPFGGDNFDSGYIIYSMYFKTIASVADSVYLEFSAVSGNVGGVPRYYAFEIDCATYPTTTEVTTSGC